MTKGFKGFQKGHSIRKGIKHTNESKIKIGLAGLNRIVSDQTREKMRIARLGKKFGKMSDLGKYNLSISHKGLNNSPKTQFKKGGISLNKGVKYDDDRIKKMSIIGINTFKKKFKDTSIEIKIKEELVKRDVIFKQNQPILGIANVDFVIPKLKIIIECDGCFWHGCPEHNPKWTKRVEKDTLKTQKLIEAGYKVFRFWEHEINKSAKDCVDIVIHSMKIL